MLFNSFAFLLFLPIVIFLYYSLSFRFRWVFLLFASYFFYAYWKFEYLFLIIFSTIVDFWVAQRLNKVEDKGTRKLFLILSLSTNLGLLFFFKYMNFFSTEINSLSAILGSGFNIPYMELLLPVGISFYTFQTLSYTIDVYYKRITPEKHLGYFALYVSFWPQLVAGPIERSSRLLPQLRQKVSFQKKNLKEGYTRIMWGFFKKIVVADGVSHVVESIFSSIETQNSLTLIIGAILFTIQIYCDFSGYSDIAIGSARLMGIDLMENFKMPYFARSLGDFWKRWHISLSTWFRDYLYIPLGGKLVSQRRLIMNLMITFLVSGFWHGANWTFIVWGGIHGGVLVLEKFFHSKKNSSFLKKALSLLVTQSIVVLAWIFFRAASISDAFHFIAGIFSFNFFPLSINYLFDSIDLLIWLGTIGLLFFTELSMGKERSIEQFMGSKSTFLRYTYYCLMPCLILWFGTFSETEFIYFQF